MRRCSSLVALPEALGSLAALVFLDLDGCREIKALPESIGDLQSLGRLALPYPVCGGCDARRYCGEACQIADWEAGHARKCQMSADLQEVLDALADDEV